jgi:hypothetical protein
MSADATLGEFLFKVGRSTRVTFGCFQNIANSSTIHSWVQTEKGGWVEEVGTECCVHGPRMMADSFGDPGDSGSFVFNSFGYLVGLYFGGNSATGVGYFTPVKDLFEHIKQLTGAVDVTLP